MMFVGQSCLVQTVNKHMQGILEKQGIVFQNFRRENPNELEENSNFFTSDCEELFLI